MRKPAAKGLARSLRAPISRSRAPRIATPCASTEDMARRRLVMIFTTGAAGPRQSITRPVDTPVEAMDRALRAVDRSPEAVTIEVPQPALDVIELRQAGPADQPRHVLALFGEGLSLAEAKAALTHLRAPAPRSRIGRG
jgi:hypothetical protein